MKAVVTEIRDDLAAILSDDGRITTIKNRCYAIGQVIEMNEISQKRKRVAVWAAAAAAVLLIPGAGAYAYFTPYTYVSLDVNPSIEYTLNRFDRVLSVKGVNEDGEEILKGVDAKALSNRPIGQAISETVAQIEAEGYFEGEDEGGIVIAAASSSSAQSERLATELKQTAEAATEDPEVEVEAESVGLARVERARELGVTPGKLNLVEKLQASSAQPDSINVEDWLDKPVKDIMRAIKANRKAEPDDTEAVVTTSTAATTVSPPAVTTTAAETAPPSETTPASASETSPPSTTAGPDVQGLGADEKTNAKPDKKNDAKPEQAGSKESGQMGGKEKESNPKEDKNTGITDQGNNKSEEKSSANQGGAPKK